MNLSCRRDFNAEKGVKKTRARAVWIDLGQKCIGIGLFK